MWLQLNGFIGQWEERSTCCVVIIRDKTVHYLNSSEAGQFDLCVCVGRLGPSTRHTIIDMVTWSSWLRQVIVTCHYHMNVVKSIKYVYFSHYYWFAGGLVDFAQFITVSMLNAYWAYLNR